MCTHMYTPTSATHTQYYKYIGLFLPSFYSVFFFSSLHTARIILYSDLSACIVLGFFF